MIHRTALLSVLAAVYAAGCGGEAKPPQSDRNDALNESQAPQSTTQSGVDSGAISNPSSQPSATATSVNASQHSSLGTSSVPSSTAPSSTASSDETGGKACGARAGDTCAPTAYCAYVPGQLCGRADAQATCKPRPESCTADYNPVCGCDGMTYGNSCTAAAAGVGVFEEGACADIDPVPGDCENVQCLRAITCAESCASEVVQAGCCPCPPGLIDTFTDCRDTASER